MVSFTVPGQPFGKQRPKVTTRGGYAHGYTPDKTVKYENLIKLFYKQSNDKMFTGPLKMTIRAYYLIPMSWSNKKRLQALDGKIKPQVAPDIDNVVKIICDALNKIAYLDDKQIVNITCCKKYDVAPRVEIAIEEVAL